MIANSESPNSVVIKCRARMPSDPSWNQTHATMILDCFLVMRVNVVMMNEICR